MDFVIVKGFLPKTDPASNASNEDADDNNSSSLCTQSRIDKWKAKHEAARFVVILVLV